MQWTNEKCRHKTFMHENFDISHHVKRQFSNREEYLHLAEDAGFWNFCPRSLKDDNLKTDII